MGSWTESYLGSFAALKSHNFEIPRKTQWIQNRSLTPAKGREAPENVWLLGPVCAFWGTACTFHGGTNQDSPQHYSLFPVSAVEQVGRNPGLFVNSSFSPGCSSIMPGFWAGPLRSELTGFKCPRGCWDTLLALDFAAQLGEAKRLLAEKARFWNWKALLDVGLIFSLIEIEYLGLKPHVLGKPKGRVC